MDRTALFRACLQAACARNKSLTASASRSFASCSDAQSAAAAKFRKDSHRLADSISQLARLLQSHRPAYLTGGPGGMTDLERDQLDAGAEQIARTCAPLVRQLREAAGACREGFPTGSCQVCQHRGLVVDLLEGRLRDVCRLLTEMRTARAATVSSSLLRELSAGDSEVRQRRGPPARPLPAVEEEELRRAGAPEHGLSPEELQLLQTENAALLDELDAVASEVSLVQRSVLHVARLQEEFTDHVLAQERDVDRVADLVVSSTENISAGNEQLRSAIRNNASTRVCVLFFILIISFSILFLNWFHP